MISRFQPLLNIDLGVLARESSSLWYYTIVHVRREGVFGDVISALGASRMIARAPGMWTGRSGARLISTESAPVLSWQVGSEAESGSRSESGLK